MTFTIDMSIPFRSVLVGALGGPGHGGHQSSQWYISHGMDLQLNPGTEIIAAFDGHVTRFNPHIISSDTSHVYGAQLFVRSHNNMMGAFYTHITGSSFSVGDSISRGDRLGITLRDHLHFALVEIIGGAPRGRYMGVNIYRDFVAIASLPNQPRIFPVTFKQDGSAPDVIFSP